MSQTPDQSPATPAGQPAPPAAGQPPVDLPLAEAVAEIEQHVAGDGWDQPSRIYALVDTAAFVAAQPGVASLMGITVGEKPSLTPVEQEDLPAGQSVEQVLAGIEWPETVIGCAVVLERLVLPPSADADIPEDPEAARAFAAAHPDRQEVRMVAGATRSGTTHCVLRLRSHDDDLAIIDGTQLVPGLLELLLGTLDAEAPQTQAFHSSATPADRVEEETP